MSYYVYIMTNKMRGTLYVGFTNDLSRRLAEHQHKVMRGFTAKYGLNKLVYYQDFEDILAAQTYERQLKRWLRQWKIEMIEKDNPHWSDLTPRFIAQ